MMWKPKEFVVSAQYANGHAITHEYNFETSNKFQYVSNIVTRVSIDRLLSVLILSVHWNLHSLDEIKACEVVLRLVTMMKC